MPYLEAIEDDARSNFQFDQTGGSGKAYYYVGLSDGSSSSSIGGYPDIQEVVRDIIGYTAPVATGVGLRRVIPATHPRCPYLYATKISSIIGKGSGTARRTPPTPASNPIIGVKPLADYYHFKQYEVGVDFASRPYPVLADSAIDADGVQVGSWVPRDGSAADVFTYSTEWARFTDYDYFPQDNQIQGSVGNMSLLGVPVAPGGAPGNPIPFTSPPWMFLPDQLLKIKWYQVPYRFITSSNSYIASTPNRNWRGRVNQNAWWNWPAGSLLYLGYSVIKYTPPTMDVGMYLSYTSAGSGPETILTATVNYERLCDIELTFLHTNRFRSGSLGGAIANGNYIPSGHNLLPNVADGKFYYGVRNPKGAPAGDLQNPPAWYSFPVEALFRDPDVSGGPSVAGDN